MTQMSRDAHAINFLALMSFSFCPGQTAIVESRDRRRATGREHNPRLPRAQEAYREDVFAVYLPAPQPGPADTG